MLTREQSPSSFDKFKNGLSNFAANAKQSYNDYMAQPHFWNNHQRLTESAPVTTSVDQPGTTTSEAGEPDEIEMHSTAAEEHGTTEEGRARIQSTPASPQLILAAGEVHEHKSPSNTVTLMQVLRSPPPTPARPAAPTPNDHIHHQLRELIELLRRAYDQPEELFYSICGSQSLGEYVCNHKFNTFVVCSSIFGLSIFLAGEYGGLYIHAGNLGCKWGSADYTLYQIRHGNYTIQYPNAEGTAPTHASLSQISGPFSTTLIMAASVVADFNPLTKQRWGLIGASEAAGKFIAYGNGWKQRGLGILFAVSSTGLMISGTLVMLNAEQNNMFLDYSVHKGYTGCFGPENTWSSVFNTLFDRVNPTSAHGMMGLGGLSLGTMSLFSIFRGVKEGRAALLPPPDLAQSLAPSR